MFKKLLVTLIAFHFVATTAFASHPYSAKRDAHESFSSAVERYLDQLSSGELESIEAGGSALNLAVLVSKANLENLPKWSKQQATLKTFKRLRDTRFLTLKSRPDFLRRSSWMFPDDGCFARAALMAANVKTWGQQAVPAKLFVFGELEVKTKNSPSGKVSWWYHVVPVVQVGQKVVVLDPAIEAARPLTLQQWLERMSKNPQDLRISVCSANTYVPSDSCIKPKSRPHDLIVRDQGYYLEAEWDRVKELGMNPEKVLGDEPVW